MPGFEAFFELKTRADLVEKLRHDLSRIRQNQTDSYAAFDFFVTAEAMMDWRYPGLGGKPEQERGAGHAVRNPGHRDLLHPGADQRHRLSEKVKAEIPFGQGAEGLFHAGGGRAVCSLAM